MLAARLSSVTLMLCGPPLVFLELSCSAPSEAEIQAEFNSVVAHNNSCSVPCDCEIISPGCPLGCWVAVRRAAATDVTNKAKKLIDDYESGGRACNYECVERPVAGCVGGRCALVDGRSQPDGGTGACP